MTGRNNRKKSCSLHTFTALPILLAAVALARAIPPAAVLKSLPPKTTLPIMFTRSVDANHMHVGDQVYAKTTQETNLPGGTSLPAGARVAGRVVAAIPFIFDKAPYAKQRESVLAIHFDSVEWKALTLPLNVYVRALADPLASSDARTPGPSDVDPWETVTQIGGDLLIPSQKEVRNQDGDVVGYNRRGGVYAHLIASQNPPDGCDGSDTEESMGIFSASACGLYGFVGTTLQQTGRTRGPSTFVLSSHRHAPKIWKNSTALLEVLPKSVTVAAR
jgi:hypothetical protein